MAGGPAGSRPSWVADVDPTGSGDIDAAPMVPDRTAEATERPSWGGWWLRVAVVLVVLAGIVTVAFTNRVLTDVYTRDMRDRAAQRLALYQGNLLAELRKSQVVPLLLSRDAELIASLAQSDYSGTSRRLIELQEDLGVSGVTLLDAGGRVVAATDRTRLGAQLRAAPAFLNALRSQSTVFALGDPAGPFPFTWSRRVEQSRTPLGVVVVQIDLAQFQDRWGGLADAVLVTNSSGEIIIATEGLWRGRTEAEALALADPPSAIRRALSGYDFIGSEPETYLRGEAVMRFETRLPFQGWRMVAFTAYADVRERVNGVLALEITGFALILAALFWVASRGASARILLFQRESAELRQLNAALSREITERKRAEADLSAAEATLQQSSKLAVLGEMSAAVSHELNQPLAAMKTYLAGAKLLLQRNRPDEALSSFQRIDDLILRMGAITRQLKSYARKGGDAFAPVDLRDAVSGALSIMEPQLKSRTVRVERRMPDATVTVMADRLRIEQVLINLLRNALDASKGVDRPLIEILLAAGDEEAVLAVRDNGTGIEDLDNLFEPFYTTKRPGEGVGLGLAISSGIVTDMGGRLSARNGQGGGAVFEVRLPLMKATGGHGSERGSEATAAE